MVADDPEALTKWINMLVRENMLPGVVGAYPMRYAEIGVELKAVRARQKQPFGAQMKSPI